MSMFDRPGMLKAVHEYNEARKAESASSKAMDDARKAHWAALVRMARAHKTVVEIAAPEDAVHFSWCEALHGARDAILKSADDAIARMGIKP